MLFFNKLGSYFRKQTKTKTAKPVPWFSPRLLFCAPATATDLQEFLRQDRRTYARRCERESAWSGLSPDPHIVRGGISVQDRPLLVCPRTGVGCQRMCRACGRSACDSLGMHGLALRLAGDTGLGSARVAVGSTRRGATGAYSEQEEGPKVASCCWWTGNVFVPKKWPLARLFGLSASPSGHECGLAARHSSRS